MDSYKLSKVGELAFARKAIEKGYSVSFPIDGSSKYDLIVDVNGKLFRVQIKTVSVSERIRSPRYKISTTTYSDGYTIHTKIGSKFSKGRKYYSLKEIDVLVGYIMNKNSFYIFPVESINKTYGANVYPNSTNKRKHKYEKYLENWSIFTGQS